MIGRFRERCRTKSDALLLTLDTRLPQILRIWLVLGGLVVGLRLATAPVAFATPSVSSVIFYALLVLAPVASAILALNWFPNGHTLPQPETRLARIGRWRTVPRSEAENHPLYGTSGIMVSLLVGLLLNVAIRGVEYLASMPPIPAGSPRWLWVLQLAMSADVILFGSLYMIAFVAALRRVPLFPRLLAAIWMCDLAMQLVTAKLVVQAGGLPDGVAGALHTLLDGNVKKTLISVGLWLPYLLLSKRVNVTYRNRLPD